MTTDYERTARFAQYHLHAQATLATEADPKAKLAFSQERVITAIHKLNNETLSTIYDALLDNDLFDRLSTTHLFFESNGQQVTFFSNVEAWMFVMLVSTINNFKSDLKVSGT